MSTAYKSLAQVPVDFRTQAWCVIAIGIHFDSPYVHAATEQWTIRVRQHADGRMLVYADYRNDSMPQCARESAELLDPGESLVDAIHRVAIAAKCQVCIYDCLICLPEALLPSAELPL